jgi:hypothetical protein
MAAHMSPAELLKLRHAVANDVHTVTVEEEVDEEDIAHPPPSVGHPASSNKPLLDEVPTMSDIAKGKQKENDAPARPRPATFNVHSEEAFPSLGGPKLGAAPVSTGWGKKPASISTHASKGPANGTPTPAQNNKSSRPHPPSNGRAAMPKEGLVSLPGRHVERISFAPSQIIPRTQLKKPIPEVLRIINKGSKARVEVREGPSGQLVFEGTGPVDAVRQALKEVASQIGSKVF